MPHQRCGCLYSTAVRLHSATVLSARRQQKSRTGLDYVSEVLRDTARVDSIVPGATSTNRGIAEIWTATTCGRLH